jgi:hypothetical protein
MKTAVRLCLVAFVWYVVSNFEPVLGPFFDLAGCQRAAFQYGVANGTFAYCQEY